MFVILHMSEIGKEKSNMDTGTNQIKHQNRAIQGVSFHVVQDNGRVWMRVGGREECNGI